MGDFRFCTSAWKSICFWSNELPKNEWGLYFLVRCGVFRWAIHVQKLVSLTNAHADGRHYNFLCHSTLTLPFGRRFAVSDNLDMLQQIGIIYLIMWDASWWRDCSEFILSSIADLVVDTPGHSGLMLTQLTIPCCFSIDIRFI